MQTNEQNSTFPEKKLSSPNDEERVNEQIHFNNTQHAAAGCQKLLVNRHHSK